MWITSAEHELKGAIPVTINKCDVDSMQEGHSKRVGKAVDSDIFSKDIDYD